MITIEQLKLMHESEDRVEFKSARHNYPYNGGMKSDPRERRHCILGYIVALANEKGGLLVLGMEDKYPHNVCGTDFAIGKIGALVDAIYEVLKTRVEIYELYEDTNRVLVIEVPSRPIGRLLKFEGVALMRTGESLREMSDAEMFAILSEQEPDFSAKICEGLTIEDLDIVAIRVLKERYAEKQKNPMFTNIPTSQILNDLELEHDGKLKYATLVLLGKQEVIRKFLPQNEIIIEYRLNESSISYTARREFQEPLMLGVNKIWDYINQPASNPLQHINYGPYILDIPSYNETVVREAVLNAVAHRTMQQKGAVVIKQSPYSMSIQNAGGFPLGVDKDNVLTTISVPRAKLLCEVLQKTGLIERSGQGVDKIFYYSMLEGKSLPDYSASDAYQVNLVLKSKIEDPAFHFFITKEQERRGENEKLSVFHLLALYNIKKDYEANIDNEILQYLLNEGLIENKTGKYRLCESYYEYERYTRQVEGGYRENQQVPHSTPIVTPQLERIIKAINSMLLGSKEIMIIMGLKDKRNFLEKYLYPSIEAELVEPLYPNSAKTDPKQKYRLTEKAKEVFFSSLPL